MGLLNGHRAVVTGGGSGIGAETCRRMAAQGAQVAVFDLNGDNAEAVAQEIDGRSYAVDVTDFDALSAAMVDASERMSGLSLLYNNAGGSTLSPIHDYDVAEWRGIGLEEQQRLKTPLERIGTPGDIADVVVFLCSDLARFVTGQNLIADGGMTLHGSGVDGVLDVVTQLLSGR